MDLNLWRTELRRGIVELCILASLKEQEAYGYEIIARLRQNSHLDFTESTVYPILARLHSQKFLTERRERSAAGPPRRYFSLTVAGRKRLQEMVSQWKEISEHVENLLKKGVD